MNVLLTAIANFITEHYILTFLLLISIFQVRIDIGKKKSKDESPKGEESKESKNEKEKPL